MVKLFSPRRWRVLPLLCHGVSIAGSIALEHVFSHGVHGGYAAIDGLISGIHIIVAKYILARHILGLLAAEPVHEGISD